VLPQEMSAIAAKNSALLLQQHLTSHWGLGEGPASSATEPMLVADA